MPIYEYKCKVCEEEFQILCSIHDSDKKFKCPECGSDDTERELSVFGKTGSAGSCAPATSGFKFG